MPAPVAGIHVFVAKRKQLIEAGATHVIATEEVDLVEEVMRITDGKGARVVFDPVGGPNFPKLISALAFQGEMIEPQVDEIEATTGVDIKTVTADAGYAYAKVYGALERRLIDALIPTGVLCLLVD
jgi:NADPH:quinone reductase-like Zn-dependent oxidoreductase